MCLPFAETDPVIAYEAPRALHRACATFVFIVLLAHAEELRPEVTFTPGARVEVVSVPPSETTSTPTFTMPTWRPR